MKRRTFLKNTLVASATGTALGTALVAPGVAVADSHAEKADPFQASSFDDALKAAGISGVEESDKIAITAPEIAENGAVVPIGVASDIEGTEEITILIAENPTPYAAKFTMGEGSNALVKCRFKMGKTSDVIGIAKVGDKYYSGKRSVKVTLGGCGG
ncbi:thiosulfate oxidation carrier protein SoxY [Leucothrix pacifica]|uniref:Thiosulfate oxidation carrier protein SoxY n=1 Tax=Leucothrix pacifica TaxID=1247513 RepID=A0A317CPA3_9GAMM|nr:thiosulfate oxidation carrier protein SoxY [Leucothrix pacifica]PWR00200.1 thiosulfate oxidation carrier protein SoxY [Leucothrix pacifica]